MDRVIKRLILFLIVIPATLLARAQQWTLKDSLNLNRTLQKDGEIKLNMDVVKQIDFGLFNNPRSSNENPGLKYDESLPEVLKKKKIILTLRPYTAHTKYNWDPIYQKKIKIDADTWRTDFALTMPTNWAKTPFDKGIRKSLEEIRASGVRYRILGERANNMLVNSMVVAPTAGINLGRGVSISGGTISGLDLMRIFEKDFWDKKGRQRRARTLEVLKQYGDSTTVLIPHPVLEPIDR